MLIGPLKRQQSTSQDPPVIVHHKNVLNTLRHRRNESRAMLGN